MVGSLGFKQRHLSTCDVQAHIQAAACSWSAAGLGLSQAWMPKAVACGKSCVVALPGPHPATLTLHVYLQSGPHLEAAGRPHARCAVLCGTAVKAHAASSAG